MYVRDRVIHKNHICPFAQCIVHVARLNNDIQLFVSLREFFYFKTWFSFDSNKPGYVQYYSSTIPQVV